MQSCFLLFYCIRCKSVPVALRQNSPSTAPPDLVKRAKAVTHQQLGCQSGRMPSECTSAKAKQTPVLHNLYSIDFPPKSKIRKGHDLGIAKYC